MPGPYGRIYFTNPSASGEVKPVHSAPCIECGVTCYRQTYIPGGRGWIFRCRSCDPVRPVIDRHTDRYKRPMSYVPSNYDVERTNAELRAGNLVARKGPRAPVIEGFQIKPH
jgi:hypothetical protein